MSKENELTSGQPTNAVPDFDSMFTITKDTKELQKEPEKTEPEKKTASIPKDNLTPLERMELEKKTRPTGLIIDGKTEEVKEGQYKDPSEKYLKEGGMHELNEMDALIEKARFAREHNLLKTSSDTNIKDNPLVAMEMIEELSHVDISDDGKKLVPVTPLEEDIKGNMVLESRLNVKANDDIQLKHFKVNEEGYQIGTIPEEKTEAEEETDKSTEPSEEDKAKAIEEENRRKEMVTIIIDKLNKDKLDFNEEERMKMFESKHINVKVIDDLELSSIEAERSPKSFDELIGEFDIQGIQTPVVFPRSGFRAYMTGLGNTEMYDIAMNNKNAYTIDDLRKRLTIIYRHMVNATVPILNFEDFLNKFAYEDIEIAVWGAMISSLPVEDSITLNCGRETCKKQYTISYRPDQLLDWESAETSFIEEFKEVATASTPTTTEIQESRKIGKSVYVEMPYTKFIFEFAKPSADDYLTRIAPLVTNEKMITSILGENPEEREVEILLALTMVRSVRIRLKNGGEKRFTEYKDLYSAFGYLKSAEIQIFGELTQKFSGTVPSFFLPPTVCPHCKNRSPKVSVTPSQILFQRAQELSLTEYEVSGI